ncbi:hypothetical protein [Nocardioides jensenii]|uniref:hypothetical protein n=1 Tax=Nocardioides jensenii TaxID=1843 RepID=UPI00082A3EAB|nr:hypothetical protein [Nocardioides jensenii]
MADRSVTVSLRARVAQFNRDMATSAAAVGILESRLRSADREGGSSIDRLSGRMAIAARAAGALGPGFIPIMTAAVPLVAGLSTQLGFAAAAGGTAILAFKGIGGALDALNTYQLDKTPENLEKVRESLRGLGPDAVKFVHFLDTIGPKLATLRTTAQAGALPGFQKGLDSLMDRLPEVRNFVSQMAEGLGELAADTGADLASKKWDDFFTFLATEGKPKLLDFGHTLGNLATAGANTIMALDPASDDFSAGLLKWSQNLAEATANLDSNEKFQEFLEYMHDTGPQAVETLGALANGLLQIGEAAAPLGGPVLEGVEAFADLVATIADSPLGTPIMGMVAAVSALNLVLGATKKISSASLSSGGIFAGGLMSGSPGTMRSQLGMIQQIPGAYKKVAAAERELAAAQANRAKVAVRAREAALIMGARPGDQLAAVRMRVQSEATLKAVQAQAAAESKLALARQRVSGTMRESAAGFAKGTAAAAGFALAMSPLPEKMGLANTATMGMIGSLTGPYGTVLGAAAGFTMDLAGANDDLEDSLKRAQRAVEGTDYSAMTTGLADAKKEFDDWKSGLNTPDSDDGFFTAFGKGFGGTFTDPAGTFAGIRAGLNGEVDKRSDELRELQDQANDFAITSSDIAKSMGMADMFGGKDTGFMVSLEDRIAAMKVALPVMDKLGISIEDLQNANGAKKSGLLAQINNEIKRMDSDTGRIGNVSDAILGLNDPLQTVAESADALNEALHALLDPAEALSVTQDTWNESLQHLNDNLAENGRSLKGQTDSARTNRSAIRGLKNDLVEYLVAQRGEGASSDKLAKNLKLGTEQIIAQGKAAGLSVPQIRAYLKELDLTPKLIETIIRNVGLMKAEREIANLKKKLHEFGLTKAEATAAVKDIASGKVNTIQGLIDKYGLTRAQAIAILRDAASAGIRGVIGLMEDLDKKDANPTVSLGGAMGVFGAIGGISAALANLDGDSATVYTRHVNTGAAGLFAADGATVPRLANGGSPGFTVPGQRQPYGDSVLTLLAPTEEVISNRHGQADRHRPLLKAINANRLADGGTAGRYDRGSVMSEHSSRRAPAMAMSVTGVLDTPWGPATIEGIARDVAREEIDAEAEFDRKVRRHG